MCKEFRIHQNGVKRYSGNPDIPRRNIIIVRDLDLTSLRLFVAVCDTHNMARAAAQAHLVGSAVSKRLAQLEAQLG